MGNSESLVANINNHSSSSTTLPIELNHEVPSFDKTKTDFPSDFLFGTGSSSYQCEGAVNEDGRGPSIWDDFTHKYPEKIIDGSNGDVAADFYHRYKEDIKLMRSLGLTAFRFSISWSRILPYGKLSKGVNQKGIDFYNNVINELISNGITPFVTIYHWDLPKALDDEYGGFRSEHIVNDFLDFAELCFKEFGDRVKHWTTINEAYIYCLMGYEFGIFVGDLAIDPYIVGHHMLLSHANAVKLYRDQYQVSQKGQIGLIVVGHWMLPFSDSNVDSEAAQRAFDFMFGWFMEPIANGDYPKRMRDIVKDRLPKFTMEQTALVKGSYDFIGLNYYTGNYVSHIKSPSAILRAITDTQALQTYERDGKLIGEPTGGPIFYVYAKGLHHLLLHIKNTYNNPLIYITENGMPDSSNASMEQLINDTQRVNFLQQHLWAINQAIRDGVKVNGYFMWSFLDTWEWNSGYTLKFGLNFIDYKDELKRIPKLSALWLQKFLTGVE